MKYEIFARINAGDDLINIGNLDAPNDRLARSYARSTFDEEDWDRMIAVSREDIVEVPAEGEMPDSQADGDA